MKGFLFFVRTAAESSRELPVVRRPPARSRERQASRRLARKKRYGNTECRRLKGSQLLPCSLIVRKERKAMRMDSRSRIALPPCVGFPKCFAVCVFLYVSWVFKIRYKFPLTTMRIGSWRKGGMRGVEARRLMAFCRGRLPRLRLPGVARTSGVGGPGRCGEARRSGWRGDHHRRFCGVIHRLNGCCRKRARRRRCWSAVSGARWRCVGQPSRPGA